MSRINDCGSFDRLTWAGQPEQVQPEQVQPEQGQPEQDSSNRSIWKGRLGQVTFGDYMLPELVKMNVRSFTYPMIMIGVS